MQHGKNADAYRSGKTIDLKGGGDNEDNKSGSEDELEQQRFLRTLESGLQSPGLGTGLSDLKKTLLKENTGLSEME